MNAMSKSSSKGGCGCGGAGSKSGGCGCNGGAQALMCACGNVGCTTCSNQGFVRPRFFAGQLLTEEDLQKLVEYVVSKNRLHNQRLWGDGVVCGLEVACNPCGGGTVTVRPGYALDCCGNDLVLACPQQLDINAMVRDLKRSLRGVPDCGEPCPPPKKDPKPVKHHLDAEGVPIVRICPTCGKQNSVVIDFCSSCGADLVGVPFTQISVSDSKEVLIDTTRHYCLYIRYCENETDPVSPYATDEGCNYQSCQATRVSEGVSFELRCNESCEQQSDLRDRLCECIGDLDSAYQAGLYSRAFSTFVKLQMPVANVERIDAMAAGRNVAGTAQSLSRMPFPGAGKSIDAAETKTRRGATKRVEIAATRVEPLPAIDADTFENWLSDIHTVNAHLASYYLLRPDPATSSAKFKEVEGPIDIVVRQLGAVATRLSELEKGVEAPDLSHAYYRAALAETIELTSKRSEFPRDRLVEIREGRLLNADNVRLAKPPMKAMREKLLDRLDKSPRIGDCKLRADIEATRISDTAEINDWVTAQTLIDGWSRYLKDCICAAANPPCSSCDDPAVLLACIEVKDCEVIEICNLKRKFVISPTALRYWLPPLNELGEEIEKWCCPEPICIDEGDSGLKEVSITRTLLRRYISKSPNLLDFRLLEFLCRKKKKKLVESAFWDPAVDAQKPGGVPSGFRPAADAFSGLTGMQGTESSADLKEALNLKNENEELRTKLDELSKRMTELTTLVNELKEGKRS